MKQCPVCQSTYEDRVDFCFKDGAVLEPMDASADPTALPDPGSGQVPIADAPTQVRKKPRGRGMFARPSVADMLTVSGSHVPPAGGNRVASEAPPTELDSPATQRESQESASTAAPVATALVAEVSTTHAAAAGEADTVEAMADYAEADTVTNESDFDDDPTGLPDVDPTGLPDMPVRASKGEKYASSDDGDRPEVDSWASAIEPTVSAAAVEVPVTNEAAEDSNLGPPGLESAGQTESTDASSLDDSWFGENSDLNEDGAEADTVVSESNEDTDVFPRGPSESKSDAEDAFPDFADSDPVEDPGFADVLGSDEVGFDDSSWSAGGGSIRTDAKVPPTMIIGGVAVLAAAVALTMLFSAEEPDALPPPPVAEAPVAPAPVVEPIPEPEPVIEPPEDEPEEPVDEVPETLDEVDAAEEATIPVAVVVPPVDTPAELPVVAPEPSPPPVVVAAPPPPPSPEPPPPPPPAPQTTTPDPPPSVWTGAPAPAASAPPAAADSNPWGAPSQPVSRGRLTISTDPSQAIVYIDDRRIGRSPTSTEVDYGTHNVRVEKLDYQTNTRVVNVQSDEVSVPIRLTPSALVGQCNLLGEPGAEVAMNGRRIGSLPLTVECTPGVHRFDVQPAAGGEPFTKSLSVTFVHPGETENLFLTP